MLLMLSFWNHLQQSSQTPLATEPWSVMLLILYHPQGDLVYVNYARTEDFFMLEREMGINCSGKILIARYGKIFRGNKVSSLLCFKVDCVFVSVTFSSILREEVPTVPGPFRIKSLLKGLLCNQSTSCVI